MMALAAEKELEHAGESCGCKHHDHDLSKRLDALWRYDQYIATPTASLSSNTSGATLNATRLTT
jgi:hypothetical protein